MDWIIILPLISLFCIKVFDTILKTSKTIAIHKGYYKIAAIVGGIAQFIFFVILKDVFEDESLASALVVSLASTIGTMIAPKIISKFEKDRVFKLTITAPDFDSGKVFAKKMLEADLPYKSKKIFTNGVRSMEIAVYCETRSETKLVKSLIPHGFKLEKGVPKSTETIIREDEDI